MKSAQVEEACPQRCWSRCSPAWLCLNPGATRVAAAGKLSESLATTALSYGSAALSTRVRRAGNTASAGDKTAAESLRLLSSHRRNPAIATRSASRGARWWKKCLASRGDGRLGFPASLTQRRSSSQRCPSQACKWARLRRSRAVGCWRNVGGCRACGAVLRFVDGGVKRVFRCIRALCSTRA